MILLRLCVAYGMEAVLNRSVYALTFRQSFPELAELFLRYFHDVCARKTGRAAGFVL
jgi:hypothetical protein